MAPVGWLLLLIPASAGYLSSCPTPVTSPTETVATLGSCLYISCRYDLCQAGPEAQLRNLTWVQHPTYDEKGKEFRGRKVAELHGTPGTNRSDCSLLLLHIRGGDAGVYGLRLAADPSQRPYGELRWMHRVTVNVTDTPPAPRLWPDPAPLTQDLRTTFGCWVPLACPDDPPTLTWEGPAANTPGARMDPWTPPAAVAPPPAVGVSLTFNVFWYHHGTFLRCLLRGSGGATPTQASRQLQVNYPPRDVLVEVTPPSPLREGAGVTLSCRASAQPPPDAYAWSLDGRPLPHRQARVLLDPLGAADGGAYVCRATNAAGTTPSPPALLQVHYPPRDVRVEVTPPSPALEGREVTLSCRHASDPAPHRYAWTLGGRPLPHRSAQLLLRPVMAADAGAYGCQATNSLGTATSGPTTLEVYYPPHGAALQAATSLPALVGARVTLLCALGPAHPAPATVQWLRDDRPEADTPGPALSFLADPARAGSYRCIGQNPAGSARSPPLAIVVWYPPKAVWVEQTPGGPVVAGRGPVRLRCQIGAAEPRRFEVTWYKDGAELPAATPPELLLPGPEPEDAAAYECQARNEAGGTRSPPLGLDVLFGPRGVQLVPEPGRRVREPTAVALRCRAAAQPPPSAFQWFRDGRALGRTPGGLWVLPGGTRESGRYRCRVSNAIGAADSADVEVVIDHSTTTIVRRTFLGLAVGLSLLVALGTLGFLLRRRWRRTMAADEEPVVEPSRTFFLCKKKPRAPGSPRPPGGDEDEDNVGSSSVVASPGAGPGTRPRGDTVVYSVLRRSQGAAKATEGPDYENVPAGASDGDGEGTLVYAALALSSPGTPRGDARGGGDTVEYVALRQ